MTEGGHARAGPNPATGTATGAAAGFPEGAADQPPLAVSLQHLWPQRALTRFAGWVASARAGPITTWLITDFIRRYSVAMDEALEPDPTRYSSFNSFFTRALRPGVRPLGDSEWLCPVDGAISQCGPIADDQIFQAKGHHYSTRALVGGDGDLAAQFRNGSFATIYLSPRDYHRIHMPCAGRLRRMIHVPGDLFSVNPATARGIPDLFARNERVVCEFDTPYGPMVLALIGATIVGSMATAWHGRVLPAHTTDIREWRYADERDPATTEDPLAAPWVSLDRGAEMGRFMLGSTVVLLWPAGTIGFEPGWLAETPVRLGQNMGRRLRAAAGR